MKLQVLQSLIGLLNFSCLVVRSCRAFLRRFVDLTKNVSNPFHYIKLTCQARADVQAWKSSIDNFNGKSVLLGDTWISSDCLKLFTDAA